MSLKGYKRPCAVSNEGVGSRQVGQAPIEVNERETHARQSRSSGLGTVYCRRSRALLVPSERVRVEMRSDVSFAAFAFTFAASLFPRASAPTHWRNLLTPRSSNLIRDGPSLERWLVAWPWTHALAVLAVAADPARRTRSRPNHRVVALQCVSCSKAQSRDQTDPLLSR